MAPPCASETPTPTYMSIDPQKPTGNPKPSPQETHYITHPPRLHTPGRRALKLFAALGPTPPTQELTSFPVWVGQLPPVPYTPTSGLAIPLPRLGPTRIQVVCSTSLTVVASPLTPCHAQESPSQGSKVIKGCGTAHLSSHQLQELPSPSMGPPGHAQPEGGGPAIDTHTATVHQP